MKYIAIVLAALLLFGRQCKAQAITPRLNLLPAKSYHISFTDSSSITRVSGGLPSTIDIITHCNIDFRITQRTDSVYRAEASYKDISLDISLPDTSYKMSSAPQSKNDTPSVLINYILNKPVNITFTEKGHFKSAGGISRIVFGATNLFRGLDSAKKGAIISRFLQYFGDNMLRTSIEEWASHCPDTAISKFNEWTINSNLSAPIPATIKTNYQLADVQAGYYSIIGNGVLSADTSKPIIIKNQPAKYRLTGIALIEIKRDKKTGWLLKYRNKKIANGNITIPDSSKTPGGVVIPIMFRSENSIYGQ